MKCSNNLKQLGLAGHNYHDTNGALPLGMEMRPNSQQTTATFFVRLLPYFEQGPLYNQWDFTNLAANTTSNPATSRTATLISTLICPSDVFVETQFNFGSCPNGGPSGYSVGSTCNSNFTGGFYSVTSYAGNYGTRSFFLRNTLYGPINPNGIYFLSSPDAAMAAQGSNRPHNGLGPVRFTAITDGLSSTLMMGEKYHNDTIMNAANWTTSGTKMYQWSIWAWTGGIKGVGHLFCSAPGQINAKPPGSGFNYQDMRVALWGSGHTGGANFVFCDGSVKFVRDSLSQQTLERLSARDDGLVISEDY
jgi:prepilin-type processing-associated H-X9-DG protein